MRLIKTIPHPLWKIDVFHNQANYLLQISAGSVQIAYKFARSVCSPEQITEMVKDPDFMKSSQHALEQLLQNQARAMPTQSWDEEEII